MEEGRSAVGDEESLLNEVLRRLDVLEMKLNQILSQTSVKSGSELDRRLSRTEGQIAKYYYDLARVVRVSREQLPSEIVEYSILRNIFSPAEREMPQLGGWRLNPTTVVSLVRYVRDELGERKGSVILDLGSGASTFWLATAIEHAGVDAHVYTVDHESRYLTQTMSALVKAGLGSYVTPILAPLKEYPFAEEGRIWYDITKLQHLDEIDLMLVDGPPSAEIGDARWPAVPFFQSRLNTGALICLDDTFRRGERDVVESWSTDYPDLKLLNNDGAATLFKWK